MDDYIAFTVQAIVSDETAKHKDLVFQQLLRNLISVHGRDIDKYVVQGILRYEIDQVEEVVSV